MNTNSKAKLFICATAQAAALDLSGYSSLVWIEVAGVGSVGAVGTDQNIVTYDTWGDDVLQKAKGNANAGDPEIETDRRPTDPGQVAVKSAAVTNLPFAFKIQRNDPATVGGTGTIVYNRGLVTGPRRPQGRSEDFDLEVYKVGFIQKEIVVDPT